MKGNVLDQRDLFVSAIDVDQGSPNGDLAARVTLIENFASNAAVQKLVDVKPDRTSPEIL